MKNNFVYEASQDGSSLKKWLFDQILFNLKSTEFPITS